jgi:6-pyruvoyl-tetrahydropterin synthase
MKIIFVPFIPTSENLAKYWYQLMKLELKKVGIKIKYIKVWETPSSTAVYEEK